MKRNVLLLLALVAVMVSCRSVDKYVKKGDYDKALDYAIRKLQKRKNLKSKDVVALEEAFGRIRSKAEQRVVKTYNSRHTSWSEIRKHIKDIDRAQKRLKQYLPIESKDGYRASFSFINVGKMQEVALVAANKRDLEEIELLVNQNDASDYYKVLKLYERIQKRQEQVVASAPIIGVEGHVPSFSYADVGNRIKKVRAKAADYAYMRADAMLKIARKGDKKAARRAYTLYHKVLDIDRQYRDTRERIDESRKLGMVHILLKVENSSYAMVPRELISMVYDSELRNIGGEWTTLHMNGEGRNIDVEATFEILALDITPEREGVHLDHLEKEVKDGFDYVLDENGNVKKDTLGNDIKVDRFIKIHGEWATIHRTKSAIMAGKVNYVQLDTKERYSSGPIDIRSEFSDEVFSFKGDERLLTKKMKRKLRKAPLPFPDNRTIVLDSGDVLIAKLKAELSKMITDSRWHG